MSKFNKDNSSKKIDFLLDITGESCPLTFVKTKLLLEKMIPGQIAEVRLTGQEPLENIPHSVKELGHDILCLEVESQTDNINKIYRLKILKKH